MLAKEDKVYVAFVDLENLYDRVDLEEWDALVVYGVGGRLLGAVNTFYRDTSAYTKIKGELVKVSECRWQGKDV